MNKHLSAILAVSALLCTVSVPAVKAENSTLDTQLYRLYNPNSGEHLYTSDISEESYLAAIGWVDEAEAWKTPEKGEPYFAKHLFGCSRINVCDNINFISCEINCPPNYCKCN